MIPVTFRPMTVWQHPATPWSQKRSRNAFRSTLTSTLRILSDELDHLHARNVIIGCGLDERDVRQDGWPRSNARVPRFPGVEISFDTRDHGRLVYSTDVCEWWEHNIRSIALGLQSLRAVDRYGITRRGEQYAGWKELPSGIVTAPGIDSVERAWEILNNAAGTEGGLRDRADLVVTYRLAAKATHPDQGGTGEEFVQVQAAYDYLQSRI